MDSSHDRKYCCDVAFLYDQYVKSLPTLVLPLNKTYFYDLFNEMKQHDQLKHVKTIQQCHYCDDYEHIDSISSERMTAALVHKQVLNYQKEARRLDMLELKEGKFGCRYFGKSFYGVLVSVDFCQLKPSSSRHTDFLCHEYRMDSDLHFLSTANHFIGNSGK
jgi:hypothetical protein